MVDTKALRAFVGNDMRVRIPPRPLRGVRTSLTREPCIPRNKLLRGVAQLARAHGLGP